MSIYLLPPFMRTKEIKSHISHLIDIGYETFYGLEEIQKDKILRMILKELGNDAFDILFNECDSNKVSKCFNNFLHSESVNDAFDLAMILRDGAMSKFSDDIQTLFDELNWRQAS